MSAFWALLITNLIPGICSAVLLAVIFMPNMKTTARHNDDAYEQVMLYASASQMENLCDSTVQALQQMENSDWIHSLYYDMLGGEIQRNVAFADVVANLEIIVVQQSGLEGISFRFYDQPDYLYTDKGVFSDLAYFQENFPEKREYYFYPLESAEGTFRTLDFNGKTYILYQTPFRDIDGGRYKGEVNLLYSPQVLTRQLTEAASGKAAAFRLLSARGELLWKSERASQERTVTLSAPLDGGKYTLEMDVPMSVHNATGNAVMPIMYLALSVDIILCVAMAFVFSRFNYEPLQKLLTKVSGGDVTRDENEYTVLEKRVNDIVSEKEETMTVLDKLRPLARQKALEAILSGSEDTDELAESACGLLQFRYTLFNVIAVEAPFSQLGSAAETVDQVSELAMQVLVDHLETQEVWTGLYYEDRDRYRILTNFERPEQLQAWLELLSSTCRQYFQQYGLSERVFLAVGQTVSGAEQIYRASEQAGTALLFARLNGRTQPALYSDIAPQINHDFYYPLSEENLLSRAIINCDAERTKEILDSIMENNRSYEHLSPRSAWLLYVGLYSTVLRSAQSVGVSSSAPLLKTDYVALEEIRNQISLMIDEVCSQIRSLRHGDLGQEEAEILEYVDQHLYDPNLSLSSIAELFHKSPTYISTLFKEQRGINYNSYVNEARIGRAIELLEKEHLSVNTVYPMVGYISASTFRRNFNKYAQRNPSEFLD